MIDEFTYVPHLYIALYSDVFFYGDMIPIKHRKLLSTRIICCILSLIGAMLELRIQR